jgi:D-lysine oxidase
MFAPEESLRQAIANARRLDKYGVDYAVLTGEQLRELEPHLSEMIIGAIHFRGSPTSSDPGMMTKAYADLFLRKGGNLLKGDARGLAQEAVGWSRALRQRASRGVGGGGSTRPLVGRCLSSAGL